MLSEIKETLSRIESNQDRLETINSDLKTCQQRTKILVDEVKACRALGSRPPLMKRRPNEKQLLPDKDYA